MQSDIISSGRSRNRATPARRIAPRGESLWWDTHRSGTGIFRRHRVLEDEVLAEIAERYNRTSRQVALNFLMRHPGIFTIPKASRPERVRENSGGVGWKMTKEDFAAIDRTFPAPDHDIPLGMI